MNQDFFSTKRILPASSEGISFYSLKALEEQGYSIQTLPYSIRVLIENALRNCDGLRVTKENVETYLNWNPEKSDKDVPFMPARVLLQDFTGVPCVVDLASLRAEA